jgi:hypothetical protein
MKRMLCLDSDPELAAPGDIGCAVMYLIGGIAPQQIALLDQDGFDLNRSGRFTSPQRGEVDLRSKSGEGVGSIDGKEPLTRRYAPTSPYGRGKVFAASQINPTSSHHALEACCCLSCQLPRRES